ncbi:hypothetical protein FACS189465_1620 [Clostridia bacterium]|nr:hypothetical protein FACS189465_1620 [Clostridia bacterium]
MNVDAIIMSETTEHEFKQSLEYSKPKSWLKTVSAFANGIGGNIYFGISDDQKIIGVLEPSVTIDKISELIKTRIEPMLIPIITQVDTEGKTVIKLKINSSQHTPYYYVSNGTRTPYVRIGSESVQAPAHIINELTLRGNGLTFDGAVTDVKLSDVSFSLFEATYLQRTYKKINEIKDYKSFSLANMQGYLTNIGLLFSDQCSLFQCRVFCTRWNGSQQGSIFEDALDDKEYSGNIIKLLESTETFIKNNSKFKWKKTGNGRIDMPDYPEVAIHEVIVNAIVHRDYSVLGSEIHVDMFDDCLEITSPGGMYSGEKIQDLNLSSVVSWRRNPNICDMFQRLRFMERRGSGIKKILINYENSRPIFFSNNNIFRITLKNKNYKDEERI